ncbi:hypothetical protein [Nonomuraea sp. NPDC049750]|uniref:hypothetical protein n=1 Tax=Nonomuraea sp. NPDC049750 TaxID=3154738 RepID=UPI0033CC41E6
MKLVPAVAGVALVVLAAVAAVLIVVSPGTEAERPTSLASQAAAPQASAPQALPSLFSATGVLILKITPDSVEFGDHPACSGKGGYSDIGQGTQVVVTDAAGKTVALGKLGTGLHEERGCTFRFAITVPPGGQFYGIEVSHRGRVQYAAYELDSIELQLGA